MYEILTSDHQVKCVLNLYTYFYERSKDIITFNLFSSYDYEECDDHVSPVSWHEKWRELTVAQSQ